MLSTSSTRFIFGRLAEHKFSVRSRDVLMNAQCPSRWWSILKSAVLCSSLDSSLPPLIWGGGGLVCESVGKALMLSAHFDGKTFRDTVDLLSTCQTSHSLTTFAFRSRKVRRLLLDLDSYRGPDSLGCISSFLEEDSWCSSPSSRCFISSTPSFGEFSLFAWERLTSSKFQTVHLPPQWQITGKFPYHLSILFMVFEYLVSVRLGRFM